VLRSEYEQSKKEKPTGWDGLNSFFEHLDLGRASFINLNWDTVVEESISNRHGRIDFDYGCGARHADFPQTGTKVAVDNESAGTAVSLIKVHGSANWLYCDCCREVFWFAPDRTLEIAQQIFKPEEWNDKGIQPDVFRIQCSCAYCDNVPLGTRLATFTYLKALDSPMFRRSWATAEELLRGANRWIFIGYSLPAADYEFRYLLKRIQLSRKEKPEILILTKGRSWESMYYNYQKFFGLVVKKNNFFADGFNDRAILRLCPYGIKD